MLTLFSVFHLTGYVFVVVVFVAIVASRSALPYDERLWYGRKTKLAALAEDLSLMIFGVMRE